MRKSLGNVLSQPVDMQHYGWLSCEALGKMWQEQWFVGFNHRRVGDDVDLLWQLSAISIINSYNFHLVQYLELLLDSMRLYMIAKSE